MHESNETGPRLSPCKERLCLPLKLVSGYHPGSLHTARLGTLTAAVAVVQHHDDIRLCPSSQCVKLPRSASVTLRKFMPRERGCGQGRQSRSTRSCLVRHRMWGREEPNLHLRKQATTQKEPTVCATTLATRYWRQRPPIFPSRRNVPCPTPTTSRPLPAPPMLC